MTGHVHAWKKQGLAICDGEKRMRTWRCRCGEYRVNRRTRTQRAKMGVKRAA